MRASRRLIVTAAAYGTVLVLAAAGGRALRLHASGHFIATQRYEDVYYVPPPQWLPVLSLGWDEALADLLWLRALVYFGDELRHRGQIRHVFEYAEAIVTLDPYFLRAYRWIGTAGMYRPVEAGVGLPEIRRSISYLERAAVLFPDDGELAWDTGASLAYELAPHVDDPEEKARIKARGVEYMLSAARLGAAPPWQVLTNAAHLRHLGQTEQAIRHLEEMYATTRDLVIRGQIEIELEVLRSATHAAAFRHAQEELERERVENFPYLDPGLYLLIGPKHSSR